MALSATDKVKLQAVVDQSAGLPLGFTGDRLAAVNYGIALVFQLCGPMLCLVGDEPEPKKEEPKSEEKPSAQE